MLIPFGVLSAAGVGGVAGDYELIASTILGTTQAEVVFDVSSFASTYKHLQIRAVGRTSLSDTDDLLRLRLNANTGSNYSFHRLGGTSGTVVSTASTSQTSIDAGRLGAASLNSNIYGPNVIDILDPFSSTKNTTIKSLTGIDRGAPLVDLLSGAFYNTSVVTSITLLAVSSFVSGSRFSLYGIKG